MWHGANHLWGWGPLVLFIEVHAVKLDSKWRSNKSGRFSLGGRSLLVPVVLMKSSCKESWILLKNQMWFDWLACVEVWYWCPLLNWTSWNILKPLLETSWITISARTHQINCDLPGLAVVKSRIRPAFNAKSTPSCFFKKRVDIPIFAGYEIPLKSEAAAKKANIFTSLWIWLPDRKSLSNSWTMAPIRRYVYVIVYVYVCIYDLLPGF